MYGDPDELNRLTGQLRQRAARIRQLATDHERAGRAARRVSVLGASGPASCWPGTGQGRPGSSPVGGIPRLPSGCRPRG